MTEWLTNDTVTRLKVGWAVITDAGLPHDPDDERVRRVWDIAWNTTDLQTALRIMRKAALDEVAGRRCDHQRESRLQRLNRWLRDE